MNASDVENGLRTFIVQQLGWHGQELTSDLSLIENQVIDSLGIFEIVNHLEAQYNVEIGDEDLVPDNFETLDALARLVVAKSQAP
ncbi:MAG TPA: acyl carrier protein [Acidimicrobiales bacterium]|nr:acyl carrier protein [Acidimicrobiales bacterium]